MEAFAIAAKVSPNDIDALAAIAYVERSGFYQIYNAHFPAAIRFKLYCDKTVFVNETPEREITNTTDPLKKSITNFFRFLIRISLPEHTNWK